MPATKLSKIEARRRCGNVPFVSFCTYTRPSIVGIYLRTCALFDGNINVPIYTAWICMDYIGYADV